MIWDTPWQYWLESICARMEKWSANDFQMESFQNWRLLNHIFNLMRFINNCSVRLGQLGMQSGIDVDAFNRAWFWRKKSCRVATSESCDKQVGIPRFRKQCNYLSSFEQEIFNKSTILKINQRYYKTATAGPSYTKGGNVWYVMGISKKAWRSFHLPTSHQPIPSSTTIPGPPPPLTQPALTTSPSFLTIRPATPNIFLPRTYSSPILYPHKTSPPRLRPPLPWRQPYQQHLPPGCNPAPASTPPSPRPHNTRPPVRYTRILSRTSQALHN